MSKIEEIKFSTPRIEIEKERTRLMTLRVTKPEWWESEWKSEWARKIYGPSLTETSTEELYTNHNNISCQFCGGKILIDETYLLLEFSFCDEYDCDMTLHIDCQYLKELIKKEVEK